VTGKKAKAPCGHDGEHVTANIVTCPRCDRQAAPEPIERETTTRIFDHTGPKDLFFDWGDEG
jgi:hypothetical protein